MPKFEENMKGKEIKQLVEYVRGFYKKSELDFRFGACSETQGRRVKRPHSDAERELCWIFQKEWLTVRLLVLPKEVMAGGG